MLKYELRKNTREIRYRDRKEIKEGCTLNQDDQYPEIISSFDSKEEALESLKGYKTKIIDYSLATGTYYSVTEYYVEENEYDEEGKWLGGGGIYEFSKIQIGLVEVEKQGHKTYETLAVFDNFADAVKAQNECEEVCFLSFSVNEKDVIKAEIKDIETNLTHRKRSAR